MCQFVSFKYGHDKRTSDTLIQNMWKILNKKSWIAQKELYISKALELQIHHSLFESFQEMVVIKDLSAIDLKEQYHQAVELANKY